MKNMSSLTHLPSKRSIDLTGIRYVNWNEEVYGYASENSDYKRWYFRILIYYHTSPETPVVISSNYEMYEEDIKALQQELGVPQDDE